MTNGSGTQVTTLERNVDDTFLLTHNGHTHLVQTDTGDIEDAIAYVASYLQIDHEWVQQGMNAKWIAIGVAE